MPTPRRYENAAARQAAYRARQAAAQAQVASGPLVAPRPGPRRWTALLGHAAQLLATVQEEMETYAAERSESWQESARGEEFAERLEAVEEACRAVAELGS
jgi:putative heme degradation protein